MDDKYYRLQRQLRELESNMRTLSAHIHQAHDLSGDALNLANIHQSFYTGVAAASMPREEDQPPAMVTCANTSATTCAGRAPVRF